MLFTAGFLTACNDAGGDKPIEITEEYLDEKTIIQYSMGVAISYISWL